MKKIKFILSILLACLYHAMFPQLTGGSNWSFVGPKSSVTSGVPAGFETGQMSCIAVDPNNSSHLFAGSKYGGLWETTNSGTTWSNIDLSSTGLDGVSAITFLSSTQVLIGNYHTGFDPGTGSGPFDYSNNVSVYTFGGTPSWSNLAALPSGSQTYIIRSISVHPANSSILFAATSIGLFRSTNGGTSWALSTISSSSTTDCYAENVVFISSGGSSPSYYTYLAGSDTKGYYTFPHGKAMLQESYDDGATFMDISSNLNMDPANFVSGNPNYMSHSKVCVGAMVAHSTAQQLYIYTITDPGLTAPYELYCWDLYNKPVYIHKLTKSHGSAQGTIINSTPIPTGATYPASYTCCFGPPDRMDIVYDALNGGVWYGGTYLSYLDGGSYTNYGSVAYGGGHSGGGLVHNDLRGMSIDNSANMLYIACDGGIVSGSVASIAGNPYSVYFNNINNDINVMLLRGFSGSEQNPNLYAVGGHDIPNTDIYNASVGSNSLTLHPSNENSGTIIDKFNDKNMIFDDNEYDVAYNITSDGGTTVTSKGLAFYHATTTSPFTEAAMVSTTSGEDGPGFLTLDYYQDPYRQGRIYYVKHNDGVFQYDFSNGDFVNKINPVNTQLNSSDFDPVNHVGIGYWARIGGISFSQQTTNSMYYTVSGASGSRASVIKYIGPNLDDCWEGHNELWADPPTNSIRQWATLTGTLWENLTTQLTNCSGCASLVNITGTDLNSIELMQIETSPWNQNVIYMMVYLPTNPAIKILKYDGTNWSNYSSSLPVGEFGTSMIMDHASNDGIYLSTDMGVYYRDATMSSWAAYTTYLPKISGMQMEVNYFENSVRTGTNGRGIWKSPLVCPTLSSLTIPVGTVSGFNEAGTITTTSGSTNSTPTSGSVPTILRGTTSVTLLPGFTAAPTTSSNYFQAFIHGCTISSTNGTSNSQYYRSAAPNSGNSENGEAENEMKEKALSSLKIYPNPNSGTFKLVLGNGKEDDEKEKESSSISVSVFNSLGALVYSKQNIDADETELSINLESQANGLYLVCVTQDGKTQKVKFIKR